MGNKYKLKNRNEENIYCLKKHEYTTKKINHIKYKNK